MVADFASATSAIDTLQKTYIQLLTNTLSNNSFVTIQQGGGNGYSRINLAEATEESVFNAVRQGKCALSLYYPTQKETKISAEYENKINQINANYQTERSRSKQEYEQQLEKQRAELDRMASSKQQEIEEIRRRCETASEEAKRKLNGEQTKREREIGELQKSLKEVQKQYDQIKRSNIENERREDIASAISRVENILNDLLCKVPGLANKEGRVRIDSEEPSRMRATLEELGTKIASKSQKGIKQLWAKIATAISGLCLVLLVVCIIMWSRGGERADDSRSSVETVVDSLKKVVDAKNNEIKKLEEEKKELDKRHKILTQRIKTEYTQKMRIDANKFRNIKRGDEIKLKILNNQNNNNLLHICKWEIEGAKMKKDGNPATIEAESDSINIKYMVDGEIVLERKLSNH